VDHWQEEIFSNHHIAGAAEIFQENIYIGNDVMVTFLSDAITSHVIV
jgi:hypothetical protein